MTYYCSLDKTINQDNRYKSLPAFVTDGGVMWLSFSIVRWCTFNILNKQPSDVAFEDQLWNVHLHHHCSVNYFHQEIDIFLQKIQCHSLTGRKILLWKGFHFFSHIEWKHNLFDFGDFADVCYQLCSVCEYKPNVTHWRVNWWFSSL